MLINYFLRHLTESTHFCALKARSDSYHWRWACVYSLSSILGYPKKLKIFYLLIDLCHNFYYDSCIFRIIFWSEWGKSTITFCQRYWRRTWFQKTGNVSLSASLFWKRCAFRELIYKTGGVQFITTRILMVDLLTNRIPIHDVAGIFVYQAHEYTHWFA